MCGTRWRPHGYEKIAARRPHEKGQADRCGRGVLIIPHRRRGSVSGWAGGGDATAPHPARRCAARDRARAASRSRPTERAGEPAVADHEDEHRGGEERDARGTGACVCDPSEQGDGNRQWNPEAVAAGDGGGASCAGEFLLPRARGGSEGTRGRHHSLRDGGRRLAGARGDQGGGRDHFCADGKIREAHGHAGECERLGGFHPSAGGDRGGTAPHRESSAQAARARGGCGGTRAGGRERVQTDLRASPGSCGD